MFSCILFEKLEIVKTKEVMKVANEIESNMPFIMILWGFYNY